VHPSDRKHRDLINIEGVSTGLKNGANINNLIIGYFGLLHGSTPLLQKD
jgi:hypothetical protein